MRRDRARRLVHDLVRRLAPLPEREVEPRQRELEPEHLQLQDAEGGFEQLLPGLITFQNDDRTRVHRSRSLMPCRGRAALQIH